MLLPIRGYNKAWMSPRQNGSHQNDILPTNIYNWKVKNASLHFYHSQNKVNPMPDVLFVRLDRNIDLDHLQSFLTLLLHSLLHVSERYP